MIGIEQQTIADAVTTGVVPEGLQAKTETIIRMALVLGGLSLDAVEADMATSGSRTVNGLIADLDASVVRHGIAALNASDPAGRHKLTGLYNARMAQYGRSPSSAYTMERIHTGAETGGRAETLILNTIRRHTEHRGGQMTVRGLLNSHRVAFALAGLYVEGLRPVTEAISEMAELPFENGEYGLVLKDDVCKVDPEHGLILIGEYAQYMPPDDEPDEYERGDWSGDNLNTGCPIRFLKGFMRRYHGIPAMAAVRQGLIKVTD